MPLTCYALIPQGEGSDEWEEDLNVIDIQGGKII